IVVLRPENTLLPRTPKPMGAELAQEGFPFGVVRFGLDPFHYFFSRTSAQLLGLAPLYPDEFATPQKVQTAREIPCFDHRFARSKELRRFLAAFHQTAVDIFFHRSRAHMRWT